MNQGSIIFISHGTYTQHSIWVLQHSSWSLLPTKSLLPPRVPSLLLSACLSKAKLKYHVSWNACTSFLFSGEKWVPSYLVFLSSLMKALYQFYLLTSQPPYNRVINTEYKAQVYVTPILQWSHKGVKTPEQEPARDPSHQPFTWAYSHVALYLPTQPQC